MPIERRPSGFLEWHDHVDGVPGLGLESDRLDECVDYYHRAGFRGLFGTPAFGFREESLDVLARMKDATWLWFWDVSLKDVGGLYALKGLEYAGINPKRPGIDFSRFPRLRAVVNHWIPRDTGLRESSVRAYILWHFKPKTKSFADAEIPLRAESLELYWANPASLDGLPVLHDLKELRIHRCRNLSDLSALPRIAPNLQLLLTTTSSRIDPSRGVHDHPTLASARIDGVERLADRT